MKHLSHSVLPALAAVALCGLSTSALGGGMNDADRWSGDLRYSVYHIAAENDAALKEGAMASGQAGRAGPESLPVGKTDSDITAWPSDTRYSVYHIAAERDAEKKASAMSGQAGRAGPETVPMGRVELLDTHDTRFSIYDDKGRSEW